MFLGFSSGLPLALSGRRCWCGCANPASISAPSACSRWSERLTREILWAPLIDALDVPVLSPLLGRRRGWLVFTQILLMAAIVFLGLLQSGNSTGAGCTGSAAGRHRLGDARHRGRCLPCREPARKRAGRRHGVLRRRLSHRHAGFHRRRAISGERDPGAGFESSRLALGLCSDGRAGADRHCERAGLDRAGTAGPGRRCARRADPFSPWPKPPPAPSGISPAATLALVVLAFVILFKFTAAVAGAMTAPS